MLVVGCAASSRQVAPVAAPPMTQLIPELNGAPQFGKAMTFYVPTCLFEHDPGCYQIIFGVGEITWTTADGFAAFTHALADVLGVSILPGSWAVLLDSPGGDIGGAVRLGRDIRE